MPLCGQKNAWWDSDERATLSNIFNYNYVPIIKSLSVEDGDEKKANTDAYCLQHLVPVIFPGFCRCYVKGNVHEWTSHSTGGWNCWMLQTSASHLKTAIKLICQFILGIRALGKKIRVGWQQKIAQIIKKNRPRNAFLPTGATRNVSWWN